MKKIISILIAGAMLLGMTGCSSSSSSDDGSSSTAESAASSSSADSSSADSSSTADSGSDKNVDHRAVPLIQDVGNVVW